MIKIGDFSKLAHVTVKALHHYGELGLLQPAHIDRYNGYRYYTLKQLPRLNRILALKDLGFSLDQVAQLIDENLSTAELRGMLRMKQLELAEKVESEQARLAQVEMRLRQLEREHTALGAEIAIKGIGPQIVLSARAVAASEEAITPARQSLQKLLLGYLERARIKPSGPWFALLDDLPYAESDLEIEMAVPFKPRASQRAGDWEGSPITLRELAAVDRMATVIHEGEYADITQAYTDLYAWTQLNAFKIAGPCREVYLPETGISTEEDLQIHTGLVEVQCPVERAKIPVSIYTSARDRKENVMQPKFINKPAMTVVGMAYLGKNAQGGEFNQEISAMWGKFMARGSEIKNITGDCNYGACFSQGEGIAEDQFEYVSCYEVTDASNFPDSMVVRQIPAYKYAVFTHKGKAQNLGETYKYIYETWLPQADVELHPDKFDMELYDRRFNPDSDASEFDILVAVK
ncbi:MAG: effector binding domain-containing protein [Anaerolineales bacterium]|nr:effector binding domain-containing protein [Chloroflexota bacterium]MBL6981820.1 effector binding domain-containing protein [Anaerolineales bacterium]